MVSVHQSTELATRDNCRDNVTIFLHFDTEDLKYFDFLSCHTRCRTVVAMLNNYRVPSSETLCTCFAALSILGQEPGAKQRAAIKMINQAAAIRPVQLYIQYVYIYIV